MTATYGQYRAEVSQDGTRFEITKVGTTTKAPINWTGLGGETTREGAWKRAQSQHRPVVFCDATAEADTNDLMELGVVFDPRAFEQAVYQGYVAYGHSMSDGYYAPIQFESWVKTFRSFVRRNTTSLKEAGPICDKTIERAFHNNDAPKHIRPALVIYAARLAAIDLLGN